MAIFTTVKKMVLKKQKRFFLFFAEEWFLNMTYYIYKRAEAQRP